MSDVMGGGAAMCGILKIDSMPTKMDVEHIDSPIAKNPGFCFRGFRRFTGMKVF